MASSCGKYPCGKASLQYALIGFTDAESDSLILRRFNKNGTAVKDSFIFGANNPIRYWRQSDTLHMASFTSDALLESAYDYQLFFPLAGKIYTITEINETESFGNKGLFSMDKTYCINPVSSYTVNGQTVNSLLHFNIIYLSK